MFDAGYDSWLVGVDASFRQMKEIRHRLLNGLALQDIQRSVALRLS